MAFNAKEMNTIAKDQQANIVVKIPEFIMERIEDSAKAGWFEEEFEHLSDTTIKALELAGFKVTPPWDYLSDYTVSWENV